MEDRRVRKSKESIKTAMLKLMQEKQFAEITINDIAKTADINRGTFYLHYLDKYDLLDQMENEMIQHFKYLQKNIKLELINNAEDFLMERLFKNVMTLVQENQVFFKIMFSDKRSTHFEKKFKRAVLENFHNTFEDIDEINEIPVDYFFSFVINAQLGIVKHWVNSGMKETPEEIAHFAYTIAYNGPIKLVQHIAVEKLKRMEEK